MGIADIIPGVSGGTIAFITGIYDNLVYSIQAVDADAFRLLRAKQFEKFWKKINGNFLVTILAGILTSLFFIANALVHLLKNNSVLVWSFFFGIILISAPIILRKIKWQSSTVLACAAGIFTMYTFTLLSPVQLPDNLLFVFLAGTIGACGMILPGISGIFILILLGKYQYVVTALQENNILAILVFASGSVLGLIYFSRLFTWALKNYHQVFTALLAGLMLGVLNKVWPWRHALEYATNTKGEQIVVFDKSVLPWHYLSVTGKDPQLFQAIMMMALGVFIVVLIEKIEVRLKTKL